MKRTIEYMDVESERFDEAFILVAFGSCELLARIEFSTSEGCLYSSYRAPQFTLVQISHFMILLKDAV